MLAFGGWIVYQNQQQAKADRQGEEFVDAMDKLRAGQEKEARAKLATLAKADQPGYRAMAQLVEANLLGEDGETKKAVAIYAKRCWRRAACRRRSAISRSFVRPAPNSIRFHHRQVIDRLKPLATPGNAWFGSAGELTAISYMKLGKDNLAGPIFAQIAKQDGLPQSMRSRAQQMAGRFGG